MIGDGSNQSREQRKKALQHDKTQEQVQVLSRQMVEGSTEFERLIQIELCENQWVTPAQVKELGRRNQDKKS